MQYFKKWLIFIISFIGFSVLSFAQTASDYTATTTANPDILTSQLALLLKPLYKEEVLVEAIAWRELLKEKVAHISAEEIAVQQKNLEIKDAQKITDAIEKAEETLQEQVEGQAEATEAAAEDLKAVATAIKETAERQEDDSLDQVVAKATEQTLKNEKEKEAAAEEVEVIEETATDVTAIAEADAVDTETALKHEEQLEEAISEVETEDLTDTDTLSNVKAQATQAAEAKKALKDKLLKNTTELRNQRTALIDRLKVVLEELEAKGGKEESQAFYDYITAVDEIKIDVTDTASTWVTLTGWLTASEGGLRWAKNGSIFSAVVFSFWLLSLLVSAIVNKILTYSKNMSALLRRFFSKVTKQVIMIAGILVALVALEVNLTPLLTMIGATGLVIGFALKETLGNFASGLMILTYRPFDVGDFINTNDVKGTVTEMSLVSVTILTADNQRIILPNNSVWHNLITNINIEKRRRIDLVFKVGHEDDLQQAEQILIDVVKQHPQVLQNEEITVRLQDVDGTAVDFICRSWVATDDYWEVRSELIQAVKARFQAASISVPHLQADVHLHQKPT